MFAKARFVRLKSGATISTPLLLPSFSSKTSIDEKVASVIEYTRKAITDEILISAYDLFHGEIKKRITFASAVFIDSGGYEATLDMDLSDPGTKAHRPRKWTAEYHKRVLTRWKFDVPTILISYDSPRSRVPVVKQIDRARKLFHKFPEANSEILIKASSNKERFVNVDEIVAQKHNLHGFDIIGVTEKELGPSIRARMVNIALLRKALDSVGLETPIHVFGSLDTISTPLYFLAGADIFDGLTWLRYAYHDGLTLYKGNYGAKNIGIGFEDFRVNGKVWNDNYYYLLKMKSAMNSFLAERDFSTLGVNGVNSELFEESFRLFLVQLEG